MKFLQKFLSFGLCALSLTAASGMQAEQTKIEHISDYQKLREIFNDRTL